MITIHHVYTDTVMILYYDHAGKYTLKKGYHGTMDDIAEHVCEDLIKHNFTGADVCNVKTGEILMVIERT